MPVDGFISLAFGVSGLFTLIEQALAVYRHLDEARYFGENVWQQYVMFEHQYFRFESWQREMQSFQTMSLSPEHGQRHTHSSVPGTDPKLGALGPSQQLRNIVAQIVSILKTVEGLCQKYKVSDIAHSPLETKKTKSHSITDGLASTTIGGAIASDGKISFGFH
jgi:Prion-inhibition and propagation